MRLTRYLAGPGRSVRRSDLPLPLLDVEHADLLFGQLAAVLVVNRAGAEEGGQWAAGRARAERRPGGIHTACGKVFVGL